MRIKCESRDKVSQLIGDSTCALISITIATGIHPELIGSWGAILRMKFDDVDQATNRMASMEFKLFTKEQADSILDFIIAVEPQVLVINCDAGMSRSVGVMVALEQIFNENVVAGKHPLHNRHVATTILRAAHGRGLV